MSKLSDSTSSVCIKCPQAQRCHYFSFERDKCWHDYAMRTTNKID